MMSAMDIATIVSLQLQRELNTLAREVELFPDDEMVWRVMPGITNSAGNLAQHIVGNLHHFVGAVLSHTGFVRDRDAEFASRGRSRVDVARDLRETAAMVARVFDGRSMADLPEVYPLEYGGMTLPTSVFLVHLEAHLAFHLGQAGYLRRAVTGDGTTSGAVALAELKPLAR